MIVTDNLVENRFRLNSIKKIMEIIKPSKQNNNTPGLFSVVKNKVKNYLPKQSKDITIINKIKLSIDFTV